MYTKPVILIWIFLSAIIVWIVEAQTTPEHTTYGQAVEAYVVDFMRVAPRRRTEALELVPSVIRIAQEEGICPLLLAVTISKESSWRLDVPLGKSRGEVGLTQIHGLAARGQDLTTPGGQIRAGARWLRKCIDKCGSVLNGINAYMSGRCNPLTKAARRRHNIYLGVVRRYWRVDHN